MLPIARFSPSADPAPAELPNSYQPSCVAFVALRTGCVMGTARDHRRYAEECVAMAQRSEDDSDKVLWLTLALSWVRLAEHVARSSSWLQPMSGSPGSCIGGCGLGGRLLAASSNPHLPMSAPPTRCRLRLLAVDSQHLLAGALMCVRLRCRQARIANTSS